MLHLRSDEDRIIKRHVDRALRELETALGLVQGLERKEKFSASRIREIHRDMRQASLMLRRVGTLGPPQVEPEVPPYKKKERKVKPLSEDKTHE